MPSAEYRLLPSVSLPVSGTRSGSISDQRIFHADTLFERTREELRERSWPRAIYRARAIDFAKVSGASEDALALGDRVMIADDRTGLASWVTLTKITRSLENPMDVEGEFESATPSLGAFLAAAEDARQAAELLPLELPGQADAGDGEWYGRDSSAKEGSRWDDFEGWTGEDPTDISHDNRVTLDGLSSPGGEAAGRVRVADGAGGEEWGDASDPLLDHEHDNKSTIDEIPLLADGATGEAWTKSAGGSMEWTAVGTEAADHTHPNKATLDSIPVLAGGEPGQIWKLNAAETAMEWGAPGDIQTTYIAEVVEDQTSGGVSQYKVEILTPTTAKTATGFFLENCLVTDDSQDVFAVGTVVMVAAPSVEAAAAGALPLITGAFEIHETVPPHSHVSDTMGFLAAWTG